MELEARVSVQREPGEKGGKGMCVAGNCEVCEVGKVD